MTENRFDRNERLFGKDGQIRLRKTRITVAGAGGLGSIVIQEAALLGVGAINAVDCEELSLSNRNRYAGAWHTDPIPGSPKVELARRHVNLIDPTISFTPVHEDIVSPAGLAAIRRADIIIGGVDHDGVRHFLNEACLVYDKLLIDLASDVPEEGVFGGRLMIVSADTGCLHCQALLDPKEVRQYFASRELLENEAAAYGIRAEALSETGPSIVSVNGTVASLGVTALMMLVTCIELPFSIQTFRGDRGTVTRAMTEPKADCYYCQSVRGTGDQANLERYFLTVPA